MPRDKFSHITTWVFDLDNTLYPPAMRLFDQIEVRMTDYVMRTLNVTQPQADHLRGHYWRQYGTTLAGLMREHAIDPTPYLEEVHDIDFSVLSPDQALRSAIQSLPGRKLIYTNGSAPYAENVISARGLSGVFDAIFGVEHADFLPKPEVRAFEIVFAKARLTPATAAMFEDDPRNLSAPHSLGMRTVHVAEHPEPAPHIQFHTSDLTRFLQQLA
ncbi:MAG TPA: pyrimidine 5'-nucleotidase [Rhodobacteraceae bacterium]|jgi:putative hydrolase of the HAD superfamily|nr:pyrimidine 5'-nucleotidase [Paracoccaceae bacterium]